MKKKVLTVLLVLSMIVSTAVVSTMLTQATPAPIPGAGSVTVNDLYPAATDICGYGIAAENADSQQTGLKRIASSMHDNDALLQLMHDNGKGCVVLAKDKLSEQGWGQNLRCNFDKTKGVSVVAKIKYIDDAAIAGTAPIFFIQPVLPGLDNTKDCIVNYTAAQLRGLQPDKDGFITVVNYVTPAICSFATTGHLNETYYGPGAKNPTVPLHDMSQMGNAKVELYSMTVYNGDKTSMQSPVGAPVAASPEVKVNVSLTNLSNVTAQTNAITGTVDTLSINTLTQTNANIFSGTRTYKSLGGLTGGSVVKINNPVDFEQGLKNISFTNGGDKNQGYAIMNGKWATNKVEILADSATGPVVGIVYVDGTAMWGANGEAQNIYPDLGDGNGAKAVNVKYIPLPSLKSFVTTAGAALKGMHTVYLKFYMDGMTVYPGDFTLTMNPPSYTVNDLWPNATGIAGYGVVNCDSQQNGLKAIASSMHNNDALLQVMHDNGRGCVVLAKDHLTEQGWGQNLRCDFDKTKGVSVVAKIKYIDDAAIAGTAGIFFIQPVLAGLDGTKDCIVNYTAAQLRGLQPDKDGFITVVNYVTPAICAYATTGHLNETYYGPGSKNPTVPMHDMSGMGNAKVELYSMTVYNGDQTAMQSPVGSPLAPPTTGNTVNVVLTNLANITDVSPTTTGVSSTLSINTLTQTNANIFTGTKTYKSVSGLINGSVVKVNAPVNFDNGLAKISFTNGGDRNVGFAIMNYKWATNKVEIIADDPATGPVIGVVYTDGTAMWGANGQAANIFPDLGDGKGALAANVKYVPLPSLKSFVTTAGAALTGSHTIYLKFYMDEMTVYPGDFSLTMIPNVNVVTFDKNTTDTVTNMPQDIVGVANNATISQPTEIPVRTGYTFGGWYKDQACTTQWNFATDKITTLQTKIYAKWTPNVTAPVVTPITAPASVVEGNKLVVTAPTVTGTGITAQGWQISKDGVTWTNIDFSTTNMTMDNNGNYIRYYATNSAGTTNSNSVTITVTKAPAVDVTIKDNATGISVTGKSDVIPAGSELMVIELSKETLASAGLDQSVLDDLMKQIPGVDKLSDIKLYMAAIVDADGMPVDISGAVTLRIPVPAGYNKDNLKLIATDANGDPVVLDPQFDPATGEIVYTADMFFGGITLFGLAQSVTNPPEPPQPPIIPPTGDAGVILAILAAGGTMLGGYKLKKKNG